MVRGARRHGLVARIKRGMSLDELAHYVNQGIPVVVGYQAWVKNPRTVDWQRENNSGHYSVVVGVGNGHVWLMDPSQPPGTYGYIPIDQFAQRWHWPSETKMGRQERFAMICMSKSEKRVRSFINSYAPTL
jgi:hypothetical protein